MVIESSKPVRFLKLELSLPVPPLLKLLPILPICPPEKLRNWLRCATAGKTSANKKTDMVKYLIKTKNAANLISKMQ